MAYFENELPVERHGASVRRVALPITRAAFAAVIVLFLAIPLGGCTVSSDDDREPGRITGSGEAPRISEPDGGKISEPEGGKVSEPEGGRLRKAAGEGVIGKEREKTTMSGGNAAVPAKTTDREIATFGAGCFWCVEAVLEQLDGVSDVSSGYMGGTVENPTYEQVCTGRTGHAEVVQVVFDPKVISYEKLLAWFWKLHDPTTLNRQGADSGTQYRSVIFYHSEAQRVAAEASLAKADASGAFSNPIVTEITAAGPYYVAEVKHQDFYRGNRKYGYCRAVIAPKLDKLGLEK